MRIYIKCAAVVLVFWLIELAVEYLWLTPHNLRLSLIRSFGLAGETTIGLALFSSAIFKWFPKTALHWRVRRGLGVSGFVLVFFHVVTAAQFIFKGDLAAAYYSFNPLVNPVIFGAVAYVIFFAMAITSTDWMVRKLTPRVWKYIHRFVYIAYISSIFHWVRMNPAVLNNPLGYLLLAMTAAALFGQLFWFITVSAKNKFRSLGFFIGLSIIMVTLITVYLLWGRL